MPSRRAVLRCGAVAAATSLVGCSALGGGPEPEPLPDSRPGATDWPADGYGPHNTRYNAGATPPREEPGHRWIQAFAACNRPVVRGSRVVLNAYDGDRRHTVGLRASDGEEVWRSESEPWGYPTPTLGAERAYVTGPDCAFGIDLETGEETWRGRPCHGANTSSGTVANGRLYLEYGGFFSALDANGRVQWATSHEARGTPSIDGTTAFVATAFTVAAVDLSTPARQWPWEDDDDDTPPYAEARTARIWSDPPEVSNVGPEFYYSPAVADDVVLATAEYGDGGGEVRALSRTDGERQWRIASPPRPGRGGRRDPPEAVGPPVPPVVTDDRIVTCLGDRRVLALREDGTIDWKRDLPQHVTGLAGAGGIVVARTHDRSVEDTAPGHARLVALDMESGDGLWRRSYEDHITGLALAGPALYVTVVTERDDEGAVVGERLEVLD